MIDPSTRELLLRSERITGAGMLLRSLLLEDVECVFGYPGGSVLPIYDAIHGLAPLRHILARHEQGAVHAADGYARATGRTGVCIATSGPGATNLVTGIATAHMDSVPLVVITGNVASDMIGTDAFQEADIVGITQPITKHSYFVRQAEDIPRIVREAFRLAGTGRKGPVLIDIPKDVAAAQAVFRYPSSVAIPGYNPPFLPAEESLRRLEAALRSSERPLILAGAGVLHADAADALTALADRLRIPVATTLLGLGSYPSSRPLWLGMPGMHGTYAANRALQQCDLLLAIGARFDDRVTMRLDGFAPRARIAHIDIDAAEIGKLASAAIPVVGDARPALERLSGMLADWEPRHAAWLEWLQGCMASEPLVIPQHESELMPQAVIDLLSRTTGGEAIVTTDVGQHQMWVAQFYRFQRPRSIITSGGLGTMGFGLPSAIGAQIGRPGELVISVNGDGGMQMCAQELALCAALNLPVKVVVINNRTLGMIKQWQELIYEERYSQIDLSGSPDFVLLAEAYGIRGLRAESLEEAERAWAEALATPGPVLIDFVVAKDALVLPMIEQGKTLDDMILRRERP